MGVWIVCFLIMRTVPKRTVVGKFPFKMGSGSSDDSSDDGSGIRTWFKMPSSSLEPLSLPSFNGWQELLWSSGNEQDEPSWDDDECEQDNENCITLRSDMEQLSDGHMTEIGEREMRIYTTISRCRISSKFKHNII